MIISDKQNRLKKMICDAIPLLCKTAIGVFDSMVSVEAIVGITVGETVLLINFKETLMPDGSSVSHTWKEADCDNREETAFTASSSDKRSYDSAEKETENCDVVYVADDDDDNGMCTSDGIKAEETENKLEEFHPEVFVEERNYETGLKLKPHSEWRYDNDDEGADYNDNDDEGTEGRYENENDGTGMEYGFELQTLQYQKSKKRLRHDPSIDTRSGDVVYVADDDNGIFTSDGIQAEDREEFIEERNYETGLKLKPHSEWQYYNDNDDEGADYNDNDDEGTGGRYENENGGTGMEYGFKLQTLQYKKSKKRLKHDKSIDVKSETDWTFVKTENDAELKIDDDFCLPASEECQFVDDFGNFADKSKRKRIGNYVPSDRKFSRHSLGSIRSSSSKTSLPFFQKRLKAKRPTVSNSRPRNASLEENSWSEMAKSSFSAQDQRGQSQESYGNMMNTLCKKIVQQSTVLESTSKQYVCHICQAHLSSTQNLMAHIQGTHLALDRYKCDICLQKFKWFMQLHRHRKRCHPNVFQ